MNYCCPWLDLEGLWHTHTHTQDISNRFEQHKVTDVETSFVIRYKYESYYAWSIRCTRDQRKRLVFFQNQHETTTNIRHIY
jgi:hypothetical protein